jgi:23S rRNA (pseudouridine1915-N3)-methyltransferase
VRLTVLAAGRLKAGPEKTLAEDYLARAGALGRRAGLSRVQVNEFADSQAQTAAARMADEAKPLAAALPPRAFTVVLDERGTALTSAAFADLIRQHLDRGTPDLVFLIGGPDGHGQAMRDGAGLLLSLGPMTWPHRLVRVMLFEQIYRAVTIMVNHPYHRP